MKRLFRGSKNGTVDPLPPPPAPLPPPPAQMIAQSPPPPAKRNGPLGNMIEIFDQPATHQKAHHHEQKVKLGKSTVTPFPIDAGGPGGVAPVGASPGQQAGYGGAQYDPSAPQPAPAPRKGKERTSVPTLAEIQEQGLDLSRRDEWLAAQRGERAPASAPAPRHPKYRRDSRADAEPYTDEGTVVAPAHAKSRAPPNGNDPPYQNSPMIPTPVPRPTGLPPQQPSPSHMPHLQQTPHNDLLLPPGARPPSPPHSLRSGTPTRGHAPQPDQNVYGDYDELEAPRARHRTRAESGASLAASTRSSEHDGSRETHGQSLSTSHGRSQGGLSAGSHGLPGKMTKFPSPAPPAHHFRSPLANAYALPDGNQSQYVTTGQPRPFPSQQYPAPFGSDSNLVEPPSQQMRDLRMEDPIQGKEKEKKKFWGMPVGWAGEKGRKKEIEAESMERRGSVDGWREDGQHASSHGHGDHSSRGHGHEDGAFTRMLGLDGRGREREKEREEKKADHQNVETVTQAIRKYSIAACCRS